MFRNFDFSSWQTIITSFIGLIAVTVVMVGLRLVMMMTIQQRRERDNRQINERLRVLIAAYKTLGGSFTGDLFVDPTHLRDWQKRMTAELAADELFPPTSERARRIRDAVEAALSDIILLGTEEQVRLAAQAAAELTAGKNVHTHDLVISLRNFIRDVLDLEAIPQEVVIPRQGPARPSVLASSKGKANDEGGGGKGKDGGGAGGMEMGGGDGFGGGAGLGIGGGTSMHHLDDDEEHAHG